MADNTTKPAAPDRARINVHQDYEVRDWAKSLGIDEHTLRNAVGAVGDDALQVREYLRRKPQHKGPHRTGYLRQGHQRKRGNA